MVVLVGELIYLAVTNTINPHMFRTNKKARTILYGLSSLLNIRIILKEETRS